MPCNWARTGRTCRPRRSPELGKASWTVSTTCSWARGGVRPPQEHHRHGDEERSALHPLRNRGRACEVAGRALAAAVGRDAEYELTARHSRRPPSLLPAPEHLPTRGNHGVIARQRLNSYNPTSLRFASSK